MKRFSGLRPYMTIMVALMFLLAACQPVGIAPAPIGDLQVYAINSGTVVYGIQRVLDGAPGAQLLQNGEQFIFTWATPGMDAIAFFGVDTSNCSALDVYSILKSGGNIANYKTGKDLLEYLKSVGWAAVPTSAIPVAVRTAIGLYTSVASGELSVPLFVPGAGLDYPTVDELLYPDGGQS